MFEQNKKYKIQYKLNEEKLVFTGKILQENQDFLQVKTDREENLFLRLENILKIDEVQE